MATKAKPPLPNNEELQLRLTVVNTAFETRRVELLPAYEKALISGIRGAERVAKRLSEKFKSLRVTLSYENGGSTISATPSKWVPNEGYQSSNLEYKVREAEDALKKIDSHWPAFTEVAAYASGYHDASEIVAELEKENRDLKASRASRAGYGGFPFGFAPPWFMGGGG